jgi:hypothetical protein
VTSVFDGGNYRVQPGQRVMFQHGSVHEVVDQEKEPCGCPAPVKPGSNEFPMSQSAGLAPLAKPAPAPPQNAAKSQISEPLVYKSPAPEPAAALPPAPAAKVAPPPTTPPAATQATKKKPGFFTRIGRFFKRIFGAE